LPGEKNYSLFYLFGSDEEKYLQHSRLLDEDLQGIV
jgi:hypothetical protein